MKVNFLFFILLLMSSVSGGFVKINSTEDEDVDVVIDYGLPSGAAYDTTEEEATDHSVNNDVDGKHPIPNKQATYSPKVSTSKSAGDPLKITMWAAVDSKVLTHKDREQLFSQGVERPPLALQKMIVVAKVDPSKNSPKTLKLYEVNAQIDPDFSKREK